MGAQKVILFGLLASGNASLASDLDLLIIMDSTLDFTDRTVDIFRHLKPEVGMDIIGYTPEELDRIRTNLFIRKIIAEGRVLYEA